MKRIILTSGPRGAGKSHYVDNFLQRNPNFELLSRDKILIELFGTTALSPYTGDHQHSREVFFREVEEALKKSEDLNLIVDYWNGWSSERRSLIEKFRNCGADRVICWKFVTPLNACLHWFMEKEDSKGYSKDSVRRDYSLYHENSRDMERDGFDKVYLVNPLQLDLFD